MADIFPFHLRKCPMSLQEASATCIRNFLHKIIQTECSALDVSQLRLHFRQHLPARLRTNLLSSLIPKDRWSRPCLDSNDRIKCQVHRDCRTIYKYCHRLLRILFGPDLFSFEVNLKRISVNFHTNVLRAVIDPIFYERHGSDQMEREFVPATNLTSLIISGGNSHTDHLLRSVQNLCLQLSQHVLGLQRLHLPVVSNVALKYVSEMRNLVELRADRTKDFNHRGLVYLATSRFSRKKLKYLHLGVFKNNGLTKEDVAKFFVEMEALNSLSLDDGNRAPVHLTENYGHIGEKVFTYSAIKLASVLARYGKASTLSKMLPSGREILDSKLVEMSVVDRQLKPQYILESCPDLKSLSIEWQQKLSDPPYETYPAAWFHTMLRSKDWQELATNLKCLRLTLPSAKDRFGYNLPFDDFRVLISTCSNLNSLKLVGAGRDGDPISFLLLLKSLPMLQELHLEKTWVHIPDPNLIFDKTAVQTNLKIFRLLSDITSMHRQPFILRCVANYLPNLVEADIQPPSAAEFEGFSPEDLVELATMPYLTRLSTSMSLNGCVMNMPAVVFALREFRVLKQFIISWGHLGIQASLSRFMNLTAWLVNALKAENADIVVNMDYNLHPQAYKCNF